ncbi:related to exostosin-like 3 [Serendipita indica DSM 11827]|uniref:peptidyl-tRNA hydrolase n=1 Tax=Serendipita indica (strain DSM 11827) TaxID=1109443 RepID=G4TFH7_SERID|nr:related to exostosin-like 3 [Serendipita indica DSM 11827]
MAAPFGSWTTVLTAASIIFAGLAGYKAGQLSVANQQRKTLSDAKGHEEHDQQITSGKATSQQDEDEEDEEARADGDLGSVSTHGPCKMVLVVRTDLGMTKGKIAAQCGHATLACYKTIQKANPKLLRHWEWTGQAKIALQIKSEEDILLLQATAQSLNLVARVIQDAGRTQIEAGSRTVLGIGPGPVKLIDQVTGHLKLL